MTRTEWQGVFALAAVYGIRMLGLFLILPVFAIYAKQLPDYTPLMVGLAIGAYGLTQALLQIPVGLLSDRIGRKPVIIAGLLIYAVGSVIAATSTTLQGVIIGRAVQGSGAVAGVIMALTADLTREEVRLPAMAVIGISIGAAFVLSMIMGPILEHWLGVGGIFWLTAIMAVVGIAITTFIVPQPQLTKTHRDVVAIPTQLWLVISNIDLLRANFGIFTLQMLMTSMFLVIPLQLSEFGIPNAHHWYIYLPVMLLSVVGIVPLVFISGHGRTIKWLIMGGILGLTIAELALFALSDNLLGLSSALLTYFIAFNLLEAALPALVARIAPVVAKGTAMGVFTSLQFLGAFCGGAFGGVVHSHFGPAGVFILGSAMAMLWLLLVVGMTNPPRLIHQQLKIGSLTNQQAVQLSAHLTALPGVAEAVVITAEQAAYVKVDKTTLNQADLQNLLAQYAPS